MDIFINCTVMKNTSKIQIGFYITLSTHIFHIGSRFTCNILPCVDRFGNVLILHIAKCLNIYKMIDTY